MNRQSGNILFLILIAVALFAALSYAVTRMSQGGTNNTDEEISSLNSSELGQYAATVSTAVGRLLVRTIPVENIAFNPPADFPTMTNLDHAMFHPQGGGATFQLSTVNMMQNGIPANWHYNLEVEIDGIGGSVDNSADGNELIAFLPGIQERVCRSVNAELNIPGIPVATADLSTAYTTDMEEGYTPPTGESLLGFAATNGTDALTGKSSGCFRNSNGAYVYYYALRER